MKVIVCLLSLVSLSVSNRIFSKEFIDNLKAKASWEIQDPEKNKFRDWTIEEIKELFIQDTDIPKEPAKATSNLRRENKLKYISKNYNTNEGTWDWRKHYPNCDSVAMDLGNCGGSYAFQSVRSIQHRICQNKGEDIRLSFQDVLSCCKETNGCTNGTIEAAYDYMINEGVVDEDCFPYSSSSGM